MRLEITCHDNINRGQQVLAAFVEHGTYVSVIEFMPTGDIVIKVPDLVPAKAKKIIDKLRLLDGINEVNVIASLPLECEKNNRSNLMNLLPDPFISLDSHGNIRVINTVAVSILGESEVALIGQHISLWLQGFDFDTWLAADDVLAKTQQLIFQGDDYIADIQPIHLTGKDNKKTVVGAALILRSEARLRHQMNVFSQPNENTFLAIQASSSAMRKVIREAKRMSMLDSSILIMGETGTGKELMARACHAASKRAQNLFMTLNCAALPDDVAESELFGVGEKGLKSSKRGIFELADGGTVFLDEIGEMSAKLQSKLLRVIQNGSFRRVNSEQEVNVDVRIISSTNKDLLNLVSLGKFREDLYYRLNVFGLSLPALRERNSDILPLAELFVIKAAQQIGRSHLTMSGDCRDFLERYPWPGNIRQLENVLTRAASLLEGNEIQSIDLQLPAYTREDGYLAGEFEGTLDAAVKKFEAELLSKLYPAYPSTRQLAKKLGLSHTAIANKLREYDINKKTIKN